MARYHRLGVWAAALLVLSVAGCEDKEASAPNNPEPSGPAAEVPVEGKRAPMGDNVWLEVLPDGSRRVVVAAEVCLRQGPLEQFMTRKNKKEHEAILAADADARKIHNALLVAGAKAGSPVSFDPAFKPPTGTKVRVLVVYEKKGRKVQENARTWVRNISSGKELASDWVFAGSVLAASPLDPTGPKSYMANEGDVICLANFEVAMLDVPFESSKANESAGFEAWTDRIPPEGTKVTVILEPVLPKKK